MIIQATRSQDIDTGHRVVGQGGRCERAHGHGYRIHLTCEGDLDTVGRVLDFGVIKTLLCDWLIQSWDHRFLAWDQDDLMRAAVAATPVLGESVIWVPWNPTAENMASHLLRVVGPQQLKGTGVTLTRVVVEETRKCHATAQLGREER